MSTATVIVIVVQFYSQFHLEVWRFGRLLVFSKSRDHFISCGSRPAAIEILKALSTWDIYHNGIRIVEPIINDCCLFGKVCIYDI